MALHTRSNSFPSSSNSFSQNIEDQMRRLRASEATTSSSSADLVCQNLDGLKRLYDCVDNWLQLPHMQQTFSQNQKDECVEVLLDGSLNLLDLCSNMRDVFSRLKGSIQDLESSLRRRNGQDLSFKNEIENYFRAKNMFNKMVQKCTSDLKCLQKCNMAIKDGEVNMLGEVEAMSFTVFESLLSLFCPPKAKSKSLFSKLISTKRVSCETDDKEEIYGIEKIDLVLSALKKQKSNKNIHHLQNGLETLESTLKEIEDRLECVFRCLIKTRVSLLNNLNN